MSVHVFMVLIKVKGTVGHTAKVNVFGKVYVCVVSVNVCELVRMMKQRGYFNPQMETL